MYEQKFEAASSSASAMDSLKAAIMLRVGELGYVPRALTAAEQQQLQGYTDQLDAFQATEDFGVPYENVLRDMASYAIQVGFESSNYNAVEGFLNRLYLSGFRSTGM